MAILRQLSLALSSCSNGRQSPSSHGEFPAWVCFRIGDNIRFLQTHSETPNTVDFHPPDRRVHPNTPLDMAVSRDGIR
jgi:hypothetical protein